MVRVGTAIFGSRTARLTGLSAPASSADKRKRLEATSLMNVSPLDLRQQRFRTAIPRLRQGRGHLVPDGRRRRLRAGAARNRPPAPGSGATWRRARPSIASTRRACNTLMTAQQLVRRHQARTPKRKPSAIVREAAGRSELLLEKTQARLEDVQREIDGLKLKRRDVETSLESDHPDAAQHARIRARAGSAASATRRSSSTARASPSHDGSARPSTNSAALRA